MTKKSVSRREFLRLSAMGTAGLLAACAQPTPQVIKEEVEVEVTRIVEGTPVVKTVVEEREVVVTATPEAAEDEVGAVGEFPRSETLIALGPAPVSSPDNFNEWVGWKNRNRGMAQLMNEPLWTDAYAIGEVVNSLAAAPPEYNDDFTVMTVALREGVFWSDGVEFTADDVVFTIETVKATEGVNYNSQMQEVASVSAPDKYTVVVELTGPNSRFHTYFLDRWGCLWIMPKHVFEGVDDIIAFEYNPPLSLGQYVLHSYDPAGFWTAWVKREDWKRTPTAMLYGESAPEYVVFQGIADTAGQVMAQSRHQLDTTASNMTLESLKAVRMVNEYSIPYQESFPWVENLHPCVTGMTFNCLKAPFDNKEVRWALTLAIDIVSHFATAYDGAATMNAIHIPMVKLYMEWYYEPTQEWLQNFTLDLGNGETFQPYDTEAPYRLRDYALARGYEVPGDEEFKSTFGYGWWKYAPDVAAQLLEKNGFSQDGDGNWLLPDGTPWKINILTGSGGAGHQNAFAAAHEWGKFGIDVEVTVNDNSGPLTQNGDFEVSTAWPVYEAWGAHLDMYRSYNWWNSEFLEPELGKPHYGHISRWTDPRMDQVVNDLKNTDWNDDERMQELGIAGMKIAVEEMPGIPTYSYPSVIANDTYYWTNWPSATNLYTQPHHHWPNFKYMLPFLEPTGR
jgi:peptide/nickel transport system substrate-binding protein